MTAAIYFKSDAYTSRGRRLMGRQVAGESFLRAIVTERGNETIHALAHAPSDCSAFVAEVARWNPAADAQPIAPAQIQRLAKVGCLFTGDPSLVHHSWRREPFGRGRWSLCGITHAMTSLAAMEAVTGLHASAVAPWDALICTSAATKMNVEFLLQSQAELLASRLGATRFPLPCLPVIPLGVHRSDFEFTPEDKFCARAALEIDSQTVVTLFAGRLSAHSKANPIPMYLALERAAEKIPGRYVLIEYGQFPNPSIESAFAEAASKLAPSIRRIVLAGADQSLSRTAWAAADIFCSLSDNTQEAFGITPLEAMASGLPVVVSDWDGYRDSVRHEIDGFLIPTALPRSGLGDDLATGLYGQTLSYDRYVGYISAVTAVDTGAAATALARLFASPNLRNEMGASGRRRIQEMYDWPVILRLYKALWEELGTIRAAANTPAAMPPLSPDPFALYAAHASTAIDETTVVRLAFGDSKSALEALRLRAGFDLINFAISVLPDESETAAMVAALDVGNRTAGELVEGIAPSRRARALRAVGWLLKLDILRLA